jgi:hypothetical protein
VRGRPFGEQDDHRADQQAAHDVDGEGGQREGAGPVGHREADAEAGQRAERAADGHRDQRRALAGQRLRVRRHATALPVVARSVRGGPRYQRKRCACRS